MIVPINLLSPIEILVTTILTQYLSTSYCITVISESPLDLQFYSNFMNFSPNNGLVAVLMNATESGCSDYVINMRNTAKFIEAFERVQHLSNVRRSDKKLIILPFDSDNCKNDLLQLLKMKEIKFIPNVVLVLPAQTDSCEAFDLVTHMYVGENDKAHDPRYVDQWNSCTGKFINNNNLFPHDMSNLQGKSVRVAAFPYAPYVILDINENVTPGGSDGTEIRIIEEFCRWVNCTIEIAREDKDEWGEIYDNQTGIGVLGNLVEDGSDFAITALYSWYEEFKVLDFSASCVRTSITCLTPAPRLRSGWQTPLLPFSIHMWLALVLTFILSSIALVVARDFSTANVLLTTFGMMITQSLPDRNVNWRVRRVTGWLLITGLIIDNAYGGGLASVFTVPQYEPSIDTVRDIVERNVEWGATADAWVFSLSLSQDNLIKKLVSNFKTYPSEELKRKSFTRSMAFSVEKLPAGYFAIGDYLTEEAVKDMTLMLEDFYYEYSVVMMRKNSPFTEKISLLVLWLHQSGLMLAWEKQVALKYLNYNVQLEVKLSRSRDVESVKPLSLSQVLGIFLLYGAGIVTAILIFVLELFCGRKKYKSSHIQS